MYYWRDWINIRIAFYILSATVVRTDAIHAVYQDCIYTSLLDYINQ
jgi:hypothetical protein